MGQLNLGSMLEVQLDNNTILRVSNINPTGKSFHRKELGPRRFLSRRKPMSAAAEDVTFALINSGMFGTAAKTNEELMMTLQARAEGRGWRRKSSETVRLPIESPPHEEAEPSFMPLSHLHIAVREGHLHSVAFLLEQEEADLNITDTNGNTPLHLALEERQEKIATLLINHPQMDLDKPNLMGRRPIHYAALQGMEGVVRLLIQRNADLQCADEGGVQPVHAASDRGHTKTLALLLDHGGNKDVPTQEGITPLHLAARGGHIAAVKLLVSLKVSRGSTRTKRRAGERGSGRRKSRGGGEGAQLFSYSAT